MAIKRKRNLRGIAQPVLVREPLFVRLCSSFVDNLTLILKTAFVLSAIVLVQNIRLALDVAPQPVAEAAPASIAIKPNVIPAPVLTESVQRALNCTYKDYRDEHYDECVKDDSQIYARPGADPDDMGYVIYETSILFASLDD